MIELNGAYNSCKVFTDNIENTAIGQLIALMNQEFIHGSKIRIMPDCHAGSGCVIGTTMTLTDKVVPNLVGVDIGCFTGDTPVWCSAGYYRTIKDLAEKNDTFYTDSFDLERGVFVMSLATAFKTRENAELVEVTYGKDIKIRCTPDHKFLTCYENNGMLHYSNETFIWVEAANLKPGTRLVAEDSNITVKSVRKLEEREDVYCLNVPNVHNFSIKGGVIVHNCGMLAVKLKETTVDLNQLDKVIRQYVPFGGDIHDKAIASSKVDQLHANINLDKAMKSLGTLGGGNHFIELNKDAEGNLWLVIHTGSRHLGIEVCNYYQKLGYEQLKEKFNGKWSDIVKETTSRMLTEGRKKEISGELARLKKEYGNKKISIPYELAYVEGEAFDQYMHDMTLTQEHACINRDTIANQILSHMKLHEVERFQTIHNYIDTENMILRKGSVSAMKGEKLIIPMNMRDGSLICMGKGNEDWNYSAPHGAGRLMSRSEAKESINMADYKKSMEGIFTTCVNSGTVDESPFAYKPMEEIIRNIGETVEIVDIIKPVYNFKASDL